MDPLRAQVAWAAEPVPDAGAADASDAGGAPDAAALDGAGRGATDAGALSGGEAGVAPTAPPLATVSFYGRVLEKGTRKPLPGAALAIDGLAGVRDHAPRGDSRSPCQPAPTIPAIEVAGLEVVHQPIVLVPGVEGAEQITACSRAAAGRAMRRRCAPTPRNPEVRGHRRAGAPDGGQLGRPAADHRLAPGRHSDRLAGRALRRARRQPGTGYFLDGIRVPELFHLGLELSVINPYLIEGVEFYPGGSPANYGP